MEPTDEELADLRNRAMSADHRAQAEAENMAISAAGVLRSAACEFVAHDMLTIGAADRTMAVIRLHAATQRAMRLCAPVVGMTIPEDPLKTLERYVSLSALSVDCLAGLATEVLTRDHETAKAAARNMLDAAARVDFSALTGGHGWAVRAAAQSFRRTLGNAPNFMEVHCDDDITVTIHRTVRPSAATIIQELRTEVDRLKAELAATRGAKRTRRTK